MIMWKGLLLLFAFGSAPTAPPVTVTVWPVTYTLQADCLAALNVKAAELNANYAAAEKIDGSHMGRWTAACYQ
jgi:hypothetical protein